MFITSKFYISIFAISTFINLLVTSIPVMANEIELNLPQQMIYNNWNQIKKDNFSEIRKIGRKPTKYSEIKDFINHIDFFIIDNKVVGKNYSIKDTNQENLNTSCYINLSNYQSYYYTTTYNTNSGGYMDTYDGYIFNEEGSCDFIIYVKCKQTTNCIGESLKNYSYCTLSKEKY